MRRDGQGALGFKPMRRCAVHGARTGMASSEMERNNIKCVLCRGFSGPSGILRLA